MSLRGEDREAVMGGRINDQFDPGIHLSPCRSMDKKTEQVDHPQHYGGADNPYEAIKVIEAWKLGFSLGNAVKYISRAGKKDGSPVLEDLKKARWYLDREIQRLS